jgi:hypothetical protein
MQAKRKKFTREVEAAEIFKKVVLDNSYSDRERFAALMLASVVLRVVTSKFAVGVLNSYFED